MPEKKATRGDPRKVPLGTGLASQARGHIMNRSRRIDDAVERAVRGDNELARKIRDVDRDSTK